MLIRFLWEGTDEDWGVGAETLLVPSSALLDSETRERNTEEWESARCVPFLEGEDALVTVAAARVLLGELFTMGVVSIFSTSFRGEYGLLITNPDFDVAAAYSKKDWMERNELIYLGAESPFQWEFLLTLGGPVLPDADADIVHVEVGEDAEATWQLVLHERDKEVTVWKLDSFTESPSVWQTATWSGLSPQEQVNVTTNLTGDEREPALFVAALVLLHPASSSEAIEALSLSGVTARLEDFQDGQSVILRWIKDEDDD